MTFSNEYTIHEKNIICTIEENEFNLSYNPTLNYINSGSVEFKNIVDSKYFHSYITTVGLYDDDDELLMVAKLAQPIPNSNSMNLNFLIKIDF